ncbi:MAG TPA: hypothetical protein VFX47_01020 [Gammaproteobacteria bacterium]|nr:hypothetical protein [Gammaproteobacteria bacterium]
MPPVKETTPALHLPRPLVNKLLHIAQSSPTTTAWGMIGARDHVPVHCYPMERLDADSHAAAQHRLEQRGETLFAMYRADHGETCTTNLSELDALGIRTPLSLGISLGIKGVLQLRGWRIEAGQTVMLEIGISEFE